MQEEELYYYSTISFTFSLTIRMIHLTKVKTFHLSFVHHTVAFEKYEVRHLAKL